jgi:hypothetical protein
MHSTSDQEQLAGRRASRAMLVPLAEYRARARARVDSLVMSPRERKLTSRPARNVIIR